MADSAHDLDALLDDALEGFDRPPGPRLAAAPPVTASANAAVQHPAGASGSGLAAGTSRGSGPFDAAQPPATRGLAFDPLARRRGAATKGTAGVAARLDAGSSSGGQEVDVLAQGLSQLLAELAEAEGEEESLLAPAAQGSAGAGPSGSGSGAAASSAAPLGGDQQQQQAQQQQQQDMQATLRALSEQAPSFAGGSEQPGSEEELLRMLAQHLGALGGDGGDDGGNRSGGAPSTSAANAAAAASGGPREMASLVDSLMQQLLSKEVLYQPMKDIGARYPSWLEANKDSLSPEDCQRYEEQQGYIQAICTLYETAPQDYPQLMQQCGQPPQEIVDELAPGMQFGPDGLPSFGGGAEDGLPPDLKDCTIQ
ncbi:Peroxisome biogenesis protein 19-1 [Chlorella vulgaris]